MGFNDFFDFNEAAYKKEIYLLSEEAIRREHTIIRQKRLAAKASIGMGAFTAIHTGGATLVFSGIGFRRLQYNNKKKEIIEACMADENWEPSRLRKRDILMAVGPSVVAATLAPGLDHAIGGLAGHGASIFVGQHTPDMASLAMHNTTPFLHAVEGGVDTQVLAVAHGLAGHAARLVPVDSVATCTTEFFGNMAGQALASTAEIAVTKQAASVVAGIVFDKFANPVIDKDKVHRDPRNTSSESASEKAKED
jgi:hypothetical protein